MSKETKPTLKDWMRSNFHYPNEIQLIDNETLIKLISDYLEAHKEPVEEEPLISKMETTDKLPEVGKMYTMKENYFDYKLKSIFRYHGFGEEYCTMTRSTGDIELLLRDFWDTFEELPNQEPTKERDFYTKAIIEDKDNRLKEVQDKIAKDKVQEALQEMKDKVKSLEGRENKMETWEERQEAMDIIRSLMLLGKNLVNTMEDRQEKPEGEE